MEKKFVRKSLKIIFSFIDMSETKIAGEYNLLIIFLNQDYTEEDEENTVGRIPKKSDFLVRNIEK